MADNRTAIILTAEDRASATIDRVNKSMGGLHGASAALTGVMGGLAGALSVGAFVGFAKGVIDAADSINDLSQRVGIGVKELAGWQLAAEQSGTSLESVARGVKGLSSYMVEHGDRLRTVGITATDANGALTQLADMFAGMPDGIQKTALATELFGKAGMDMIPMLNMGSAGLADAQQKAAAYAEKLAELAPRADEFNDRLAELTLTTKGLAIDAVLPLMDGLIGLSAWFKDATSSAAGFGRALGFIGEKLAGDSALRSWATGGWWVEGAGKMIERMGAPGAGIKVTPDMWVGANKAQGYTQKGGDMAAHVAAWQAEALLGKAGTTKAAKGGRAAEDFAPLMRQIGERTAALAADAATTEKLTAAQQMALKMMTDLQGGYLKLTDAQKASLSVRLEDMLAADRQNEQLKAEEKAREAAAHAAERQAEADAAAASKWRDQIDPARALAREIEELNHLRGEGYLRADEAARAEDMLTQEYERQRDKVNELGQEHDAAFKEMTDAVNNWSNEAANAFADFVTGGKTSFTDMVNSFLRDIARMQAKQMFDPLAKEAGNWIKGLFGGSGQSAAEAAHAATLGDTSWFSDGGVPGGTGLHAYVNTIVSRPTVFPFARGIGLMGEAGPEAIMPLTRGADGKLGVAASGGGGSVSITIRNEGRPQEVVSSSAVPDIRGMVIDIVTRDIAQDGRASQAIQQTFGARRVATAY